MVYFLSFISIAIIGVFVFKKNKNFKEKWLKPTEPFNGDKRIILKKNVAFYNSLNEEEKIRFEYRVQEFLLNCRITGIETSINVTDKLLVASSAIIPIFGFDTWRYTNIKEVLLYPTMFNNKFETEGSNRSILGMVGTGYMDNMMVLSKQALRHGFENEMDKKNTAIHEFIHLIDKIDGYIDGVPSLLLEKQYTIPWIDLINKKIDEIFDEESDINPYGGTNKAEFFSVASEYFFERPKLLAKKHPELYELLEKIFNQKMDSRKIKKIKLTIGRNDPCPCKSGLKFKKCCGKVYNN
ncbi:MAG: peptidase [Lutibacter sp.]|uniref:zinc-dependent peptidase n=1 Tax=Lutibacter sp. TaxID=1925666 RepID=UPI0019D8F5A1|nr:zinc-dependent peptidase [Lutibacter sp.]NOR27206.1 peptidase [Lutibacter sp.]